MSQFRDLMVPELACGERGKREREVINETEAELEWQVSRGLGWWLSDPGSGFSPGHSRSAPLAPVSHRTCSAGRGQNGDLPVGCMVPRLAIPGPLHPRMRGVKA